MLRTHSTRGFFGQNLGTWKIHAVWLVQRISRQMSEMRTPKHENSSRGLSSWAQSGHGRTISINIIWIPRDQSVDIPFHIPLEGWQILYAVFDIWQLHCKIIPSPPDRMSPTATATSHTAWNCPGSTESCYIGLPSNSQKHQGSHTSGTLSVCSSYGLRILLQYSIIVMFFLFKTIGKKPCYFFVLHHSWKHLDSVRPRQHLHFQPPVFPLWRHG